MSAILIKASDMGDESFFEKFVKFTELIPNLGNDHLEIIVDINIPIQVLEYIKNSHLIGVNKTIKFMFNKH